MTDTMQAISQDELGGPEVLKRVTLPVPKPGMGEILVRVHAASVNPVDVMNRKSGAFVGKPPFVLGWDVSGTVEAIGPGVIRHCSSSRTTSADSALPMDVRVSVVSVVGAMASFDHRLGRRTRLSKSSYRMLVIHRSEEHTSELQSPMRIS